MFRLILSACMTFLFLLPARAQDTPDEDILVDVAVNYGTAFREGSWVPVDVLVSNTERDVSGFVEIRTFDFSGATQSPIYRVPAESPKGSKKRFRVHCKLERSDRLEARLYHGSRPVSPIPARLTLTPIDRKDYLGLVLDDQHHDYGFLSSGDVIGSSDARFHREGLETELLGYLADHLPCYTTFDLIVLGNIDPERITPQHRELLRRYVSLGGSLVISLGQNANQYKGSWLEPLMGVTIGENQFQSEEAIAQRAFPGGAVAAGLSAAREGMVTTISPAHDGVAPIGNNYALGAISPLGAGRVATITVDATSGLLQNFPPFLGAWNRLLQQSIMDRPLNLPAAIDYATQQLPSIAGVKLFPVSSVITYLLLYFAIAIVGNWLFWNWRKRREMAWVCLVFFSFGFTAYAMIFGTQGRARSTELEQLEFLELSSGSPVATLHGITGLLAKGSGRFSADLIHPESLVSDAARTQFMGINQPGGVFGPQSENPFQFLQGDAGKVEALTVGASEMRFLEIEAPLELAGAIETDLIADDTGIHGTIQNRTGLNLRNPTLIYQGHMSDLRFSDNLATVTTTDIPDNGGRVMAPSLSPQTAFTAPDDMDHADRLNFTNFLSGLPGTVLNHQGTALPPCLVAWAEQPPFGSIDMGDRAQVKLGATMVIAWLDVKRNALPAVQDLAVNVKNKGYPMGAYSSRIPETLDSIEEWNRITTFMDYGSGWDIGIAIPDWIRASDDYTLEIVVETDDRSYDGYHGQCHANRNDRNQPLDLEFGDESNNAISLGTPSVRETELDGSIHLERKTYTLKDWERLLPPRSSAITLSAWPEGETGNTGVNYGYNNRFYMQTNRGQGNVGVTHYGNRHYHVAISARASKNDTTTTGE